MPWSLQSSLQQKTMQVLLLVQEGAVVLGPGSPHRPQQQQVPQPAACWALDCQPCWPWQHRQQQTEQASRQQQHLQRQEHRALLLVLLALAGRQRLAQQQARSKQPHMQLLVVVLVLGLAAVPPVAVAVVLAATLRALVC